MVTMERSFKRKAFSRTGVVLAFVLYFAGLLLYRLFGTFGETPLTFAVYAGGVCIEAFLFYRAARAPAEKGSSAALFPALAFAAVYFAQAYSVRQTGEYVSILALENARHITLLMTEKLKRKIFEALAVCIVFCAAFFFLPRVERKRKASVLTPVCLILFFGQFPFAERLPALSPFADFAVKSHHLFFPESRLTPFDASRIRQEAYRRPLPFEKAKTPQRPNVFLFFAEGLSARLIGAYDQRFKALTPEIDAFADASLKVENYYNHTAATEKGIFGSLSSLYLQFFMNGGGKTDIDQVRALPSVLNENGYETVFTASTVESSKALIDILKRLKFAEVISTPELRKNILKKGYDGSFPRDEEFFDGIIKYFENRSSEAPVFAAFYNLETHAFTDTAPDGIKYGDGTNRVLNTVANFDFQFGKFFDWFKKSKYAKNSIVILTADHAHFYESPYVSLMSADKSYKPFFADRIPLLIYAPFIKQPKTLDAKGMNSLALAPTILQYLGIRKVKNTFSGTALFDDPQEGMNLSEIGYSFFVTDENGIRHESRLPETEREDFIRAKNTLIFASYSTEE